MLFSVGAVGRPGGTDRSVGVRPLTVSQQPGELWPFVNHSYGPFHSYCRFQVEK